MSKTSTQILTNHQKQRIQQVLDLADNKEDALTLTEFEGFLFGLAITPDVILPSEWMPVVFGEEMVTFDSEEQANILMQELMRAYNAYTRAFHEGTLTFPFDMEKLSSTMLDDIQDWSYGLLEALRMRPEIWYIDSEENYEDMPEYVKDVILSFCIVHGVVYPEEGRELFEKEHGKHLNDLAESMAILLGSLPLAVETLQAHGSQLEKERHQNVTSEHINLNSSKTKIGRNDSCPCGSGKKYKKCCGMN